MKTIITLFLSVFLITQIACAQTIKNFSKNGRQLTKFDNLGNVVDAHDGEIALFNGVYYLYGTSYDCGFEWGNKSAPFCGFKVYSSTDLDHWTDKGFLFDAKTTVWQTRCDGKTYGCFRPHVIYNQKTRLYVLWINVYDNRVGYRVFTSKKPVGPFVEVKEPTLAVNSEMPVAGLNNGDHDTFVDDDGTAYLAYTDWRTQGSIVIEKLSPDYLTGTGQHVKSVTDGKTEAPALFKRKGIYYMVYSDPNCGYCSGTGASYRTAKSPLGPWSAGKKISDNSCGGQPSFVSTFKLNSETVFLFGSDLWNNAAKNEALANFYWAPLTFAADGSINPLVCGETAVFPKDAANKPITTNGDFTTVCDINKTKQRGQVFSADRSGTLYQLNLTTFKSGYPDADLVVEVHSTDDQLNPSGPALATVNLKQDNLSWAPKNYALKLKVEVVKGKRYVVVIKSATTTGCYGIEYNEVETADNAVISNNAGGQFMEEKGKALKLRVGIK
ncbi:family 43 glycosylhydrolase [Mucilaginibacter aquaedulcis]|uniref:family 43 glycosylhydrolase n=1 Tax=Mucilaginibacter aquaedulcis TaxID=1187081 RepID=UPI0025B2BB57|nr:family 43 glycosylhydrolase [Mucilaginibacter aquaedulcis]MDN3550686.1 family 43 glycosylhydrolase [Mucilaginibacter aquaedulcis]